MSKDFLISKGINSEQIYFLKGFGEVELSNEKMKNEKLFIKFRRTDFLILN